MTGIVSGIDYSLLFGNGGGSTLDASSNILNALYSATSNTATATSSGNPILDLKLAEQNQTAAVAREAKDPTVVRDLAAFKTGVSHAKTVSDALDNPNVLKVLLTANGLGDQAQYPALAKKALLSDPNDPKSLVNQLSDTRWKSVVQTYDLASKGLAGLSAPAVQSKLSASYTRVTWLASLDQATPGLSSAITFKEGAGQITSVDQILGDSINRDVVTTALGIPREIAYQDLPAQELAISSRLDISRLKDPQFVTTLTDQYLLAKQQANQGSSGDTSITTLASKLSGITV